METMWHFTLQEININGLLALWWGNPLHHVSLMHPPQTIQMKKLRNFMRASEMSWSILNQEKPIPIDNWKELYSRDNLRFKETVCSSYFTTGLMEIQGLRYYPHPLIDLDHMPQQKSHTCVISMGLKTFQRKSGSNKFGHSTKHLVNQSSHIKSSR